MSGDTMDDAPLPEKSGLMPTKRRGGKSKDVISNDVVRGVSNVITDVVNSATDGSMSYATKPSSSGSHESGMRHDIDADTVTRAKQGVDAGELGKKYKDHFNG